MTTLRTAALIEIANVRDYIWLLDEGGTGVSEEEMLKNIAKIITTLKAALADPVQEPVAWRWRMRNLTDAPGFVQPWTVTTYYPREQANEIEPLYTTPPQRKPLPVDQIYEMYSEPSSDAEMVEFARAIERAHGIK
jgi:hypothetical protein